MWHKTQGSSNRNLASSREDLNKDYSIIPTDHTYTAPTATSRVSQPSYLLDGIQTFGLGQTNVPGSEKKFPVRTKFSFF